MFKFPKLYLSFILINLFLFHSCKNEEEKVDEVVWTTEKSTEMNKNFALEEELDIKMYLENRKAWKTVKTGTGLRYYIYEKGTGEKAVSGKNAEVKFSISLLDGRLCYKTDSLETEIFEIDKSEIETGVQEGIKKMRVGDKAKLIIPSHLGHGLVGDMDKIPPLSVLVIDIHLISLK
jgi:FKBP-type peptidyl-prolyl cis-trans isomerase